MQRKNLTLKQKAFVDRTIETLNPTQAVREVYQLGSRGGTEESTAGAIAVENLNKPNIRQEILKRMEEKKLNGDTIARTHKRNILQSENYAASNTALDMFYQLTESYPAQKTINTNINLNLNPQAIRDKKQELQEELERIKNVA